MTALALLNRALGRIFGIVIAHAAEGEIVHPLRLWTGKHVRGSWCIGRVTQRDPDGFVHWTRRSSTQDDSGN